MIVTTYKSNAFYNWKAGDRKKKAQAIAWKKLLKKQKDEKKRLEKKGTALVSQADIDNGLVKAVCLPPKS